jgi:hypothetical protein
MRSASTQEKGFPVGFRSQLFKTIFLKQKMSFNMAAMAQKFDKTYRMAGGHT